MKIAFNRVLEFHQREKLPSFVGVCLLSSRSILRSWSWLFLHVFLFSLAFPAYSVELKGMRVLSSLGQPLYAEIELGDLGSLNEEEVRAGIASEEDFERVGAERESYLADINFSLSFRADGSGVVRVASRDPFDNPFLNFIVEVVWPYGRALREYAAIIEPGNQGVSVSTYGPIKEKDTLWSIAKKLRPSRAITVQQMMLAIQRNNPDSFLDGNINLLRSGAFLKVPRLVEIGIESAEDAISEVREQIYEYQEARGRGMRSSSNGSEGRLKSAVPELRLLSVSEKNNLDERSILDERFAEQEVRLTRTLDQLNEANESILGLTARVEELSSQLDLINETIASKDEEIAALKRELRRKDKETLDMGKILEVFRSIHPALGDPWWAAGAICGSFFTLILVFLLFRRKREKNDDLIDSYSSDLVEPELTNENLPDIDKVSPELAPNENPKSADGAMFTDGVSEVRIREHDDEKAVDAASDVNEESVNATESTSSDEPQDVMVEKVPEEVNESSEPTEFQTESSDKNEDSEDDGLETISSKLDLSRAYIEMGDSVGARALLEEIIIEGDSDQKTEARELLIKIEMQPD